MSRAWRRRQERDPYRKKARSEGYRSRAAYKLKQIVRRENVVRPGDTVIDLGAAPGGWSQVAAELVGPTGRVIAVDIKPMDDMRDVVTVQGDVRDPGTIDRILDVAGGPADVVLSDMAPRISGNYAMDHAKSIALSRTALEATDALLRPGGRFAVKVFQGDMFKDFYDEVGGRFAGHKGHKPKASRKQSSEVYVLGFGFRGSS